MRLSIEHVNTFQYTNQISEAYTELRLRPLDANGQVCLSFSLRTEPHDEIFQYKDRFGNDVRHFDTIQPHERLVAESRSEVLTPDHFIPDAGEISPLDEFDYLMATNYVTLTPDIQAFAANICVGCDPYEAVKGLMSNVHALITYEKGATDVNTTAAQVLALGRGVCQDYTHLMLAACRSQGFPARYVSGYLYAHGFSSATHAWVDVYIPGRGWVSLDPTHNSEQSGGYVRLAIGRDYADVPPTRGVFVGNAKEEMSVSVSVKAV
jgi:transglutaminase-like putative cysteine protease